MTQGNYNTTPSVGIVNAFMAPFDRVRWGPVLAGFFSAMSCLTLLSVLGLAVGLSAWDPGDNARNYSIGAGIWSIISAIISFYIGGWLAARSAAAVGERNGILNGSLVWAVAIPLLLFLLGGGFTSLAQTAVNGSRPRVIYMQPGRDFTDNARVASGRMGDMTNTSNQGTQSDANANQTPTREEARAAAKGAWWTLVSLVLGLCAAGVGGMVGAQTAGDRDIRYGGTGTGGDVGSSDTTGTGGSTATGA